MCELVSSAPGHACNELRFDERVHERDLISASDFVSASQAGTSWAFTSLRTCIKHCNDAENSISYLEVGMLCLFHLQERLEPLRMMGVVPLCMKQVRDSPSESVADSKMKAGN
jgi:hypothetical protein